MSWTSAGIEARASRVAAEMAPPDDRLPSRLAQQRFSQLVVDHRQRLYCYLRSRGASPDLAEDCLQEALVRAFRSLDTLRDWDKASGWLYGIARHVYLDQTRRAAVRSRPVPDDRSSEPPALDEVVDRAALADRLRGAVADLGSPRAEVVELYYAGGLSVDEIGDALGLPAGTVKTHLYRARAELRRRLGPREELR
jgi:RNA polymerase sigma-70 factor (ECF subfamily)